MIILDVISASNFWGRIIEHRLPFCRDASTYDTTIYLQLAMDLQLYFSNAAARKKCCNAEKYDICVFKTEKGEYQR